MSEHSAKRQRLDSTGRFSPASPPFDVVAKASGHTKTLTHPRTPTSPPHSSMSSQANGGPAMNNPAAPSDRSPPASTAMSHSLSQSASSASNPHPMPTPASTTGAFGSATIDSDGDAMMEDGADDDAVRLAHHRPTNHNRQTRLEFSARGGLKAAEGVSGDQLFRVAESRCEVSRPHGSQNLFKLYSLESLARSVARTDPVTGEKINKLRKSYEGHIKAMQIAGKPKAQKMEGVFSIPASYPLDYYQQTQVHGKEIERALNPEGTALTAEFGNSLDLAFAGMAPGPLPNADANRYRTYIGTDDIIKAKPQDGPPQRPTPHASNAPTPGNSAAGRGVNRPERSGSKRHYTDAAFQGYGEGYNDDFGAESTGGEDNTQGNMAKRRKLQFERTPHSVEVGGVRR
ncbi:Rox3 mediator complex subunit-domain-containing protein [Paraphoma chrysanthemicola]|uniref:Mediator of RNA polymerase II transcription subunit 19 n=1 Tax=Paraphoma chrysanthemicola TaxID=798071 RepID=A0A8K0W4I4_9PLEO|nr:Rox3 mediator complex subunit-domain-containing protein [Paraphoma chrysanthemicola]